MSFVDTSTSPLGDPSFSLVGDSAAPYALISVPTRYIDTIIPNVVVEERHSDRSEITQHPIQTGATVSDHSFALPATVSIRAGFSDCTAAYPGYVQDVYQWFLSLAATRQPFSVGTGKRQYDDMLIREIEVTTDQYAETALMIVVNLQQVTLTDVDGGATDANQAYPQQTGPEANQGNVAPIQNPSAPLGQGGIGSDAVASAQAATIASYQTPVTTPAASGGIGSA